jgi:hypothetical protein
MQDTGHRIQSKFLSNALTMPEAAKAGCLQAAGGAPRQFSDTELNAMADLLARMVTVFSVGDGQATANPLAERQLRAGTFSDGARVIRFVDGRPPITDLVVTRTALNSALHILKDAR